MLSESDNVRLHHMVDASREAVGFVEKCSRQRFDEDRMLQLAEVRLLEIVGEAAKRLSDELRQRYPEVAWRQISRTRDRLSQGYFDVDLDIVWAILSTDLPALITQLEEIKRAENG